MEQVDRNRSVGASEVAALFGCSPWQSEYGLWLLKTGLVPEREDTERLRAGRYLEQAILEEWKNRNHYGAVSYNDHSFSHAIYGFITATPDAIYRAGDGRGDESLVADIKTVTRERRADWHTGTPEYYRLQLQQQMLVTGAARGVLIAQFGFDELSHEWFDADPNVQDEIVKRCITFWKRVTGELPPPDPDSHPATTDALKRRESTAKAIELPPHVRDWSDNLAMIDRHIKELEDEAQGFKNKIRAAMGDASVGVWPDGTGWRIRQQPASEFMVKKKAHSVMVRINNKESIGADE